MIHIDPVEPTHDEWVEWRARCRAAHDTLRASFSSWREDMVPPVKKPSPRTALYGAQRDWIAQKFFLKCAYCEAKLDPTVRRGQLDHYRPQKSVRTGGGEIVMLRWGCVAEPRPHPGYYWLAYEWSNLLPVCSACNTRTRSFQGRMGGKSDWFPVVDGRYTAEPGREADDEKPLLLNPWLQEPSEHMTFCWQNGKIAPTTDAGRATVDLLDLNRDLLADERRVACDRAIELYTQYMEHRVAAELGRTPALRQSSREEAMRLNGVFRQYRIGDAAYSAFLVAALDHAESTAKRALGVAA